MFKFPDLLGQELDLNGLTYNGFIRCKLNHLNQVLVLINLEI